MLVCFKLRTIKLEVALGNIKVALVEFKGIEKLNFSQFFDESIGLKTGSLKVFNV